MSNFKSIKKYLTWDNIVFVLLLGLIVLYFLMQTFVLQTSAPQVAVTTTSMVPTYMGFDLYQDPNQSCHNGDGSCSDVFRGDLLIVQNKEPHIGDVIVFNNPDPHDTCPIPNPSLPVEHKGYHLAMHPDFWSSY